MCAALCCAVLCCAVCCLPDLPSTDTRYPEGRINIVRPVVASLWPPGVCRVYSGGRDTLVGSRSPTGGLCDGGRVFSTGTSVYTVPHMAPWRPIGKSGDTLIPIGSWGRTCMNPSVTYFPPVLVDQGHNGLKQNLLTNLRLKPSRSCETRLEDPAVSRRCHGRITLTSLPDWKAGVSAVSARVSRAPFARQMQGKTFAQHTTKLHLSPLQCHLRGSAALPANSFDFRLPHRPPTFSRGGELSTEYRNKLLAITSLTEQTTPGSCAITKTAHTPLKAPYQLHIMDTDPLLPRKNAPTRRAGVHADSAAQYGTVAGQTTDDKRVTTSFLLGNLHCPSCVSSIQEALGDACGRDIVWISPNVVTSVVTVEHRDTGPAVAHVIATMAKSLEAAGFEVCSVTTTSAAVDTLDLEYLADRSYQAADDSAESKGAGALGRLLTAPRFKQSLTKRQQTHLANCEECRHSRPHTPRSGSQTPLLAGARARLERSGTPDLATLSTLESITAVGSSSSVDSAGHAWRATYSIGGMTCTSCVRSIEDELKRRPNVAKVVVNLVNNSATVDVTEKDEAQVLVQVIEDIGYDISYVPNTPYLTIRRILAAIEAADPSFHPSIYHPPTIEERSKAVVARHQRQLLRRVYLSLVIAIPTFIIGIAYMNLVSDDDPWRHYLMKPWLSSCASLELPGRSLLDQIVQIVREGQTKRAPMERVADMLTAYFVPIITLIAILTWATWTILGLAGVLPESYLDATSGWVAFALQFAIAVFVVACPCGLGLAAPTAIFVGGGLAAKHGILAKGGGEAFEKASKIDLVVFDKTGTLTVGGEPKITDALTYPGATQEAACQEDTDLLFAALKAVEENSSHPIAKAIVSYCKSRTEQSASVDNLQEIPGRGMKAICRGQSFDASFDIIVGNESLMSDNHVAMSESTAAQLETWKREAKSVALVATKPISKNVAPWTLAAALSIADPIRPEAVGIVEALRERGTSVWMLSGDNLVTAKAVASQVGIDPNNVLAEVLPSQKAEKITYLQSTMKARTGSREHTMKRATVAMVGDGINDSPALTRADVGIAIGSGSDVAISSADFVLVSSDLRAVVTLLELSRTVFRRIRLNFAWAIVYNVLALPVAAGCFYPFTTSSGQHIRLDPVWAALAMALSSISVVLSSLALRIRIPWIGFQDGKIGS
ncbi:cation-transporting ATPase pacS [Verticillium alfalfae VaMs.102]|uniref:Cation-transporting ATPase pacS n=1 Tax=Verticillium alfalfae (strain VaMs.102 / ATCC MYA-4576 / FGSC 10136) TaxID=526221 RepID=C9SSP3_VERA1|nr:cation-transporting ATPase pacS [Verticillium alfalfae VaMs.102]EEY21808.1 cation-transporting ATPase pacS [Verticillium alfalfae VaMs.102]